MEMNTKNGKYAVIFAGIKIPRFCYCVCNYLRNKISFFEVHWDMNCSWSRDQIL